MDSTRPMNAIPRRPVGAAAVVAPSTGVPSTRPPSFATYPPSMYPASIYSHGGRNQHQYQQPSLEPQLELLELQHDHLNLSAAAQGYPVGAPLPIQPLQRVIPHSPAWHKAKIILRFLLFIFELAIIILCAITAIRFMPSWWDDRGIQAWDAVLPIVCVLIVYDLVELATFWVRRRLRRGMHPGVTVAADIIAWLISIPALVFNLYNAVRQWGVMLITAEVILAVIFVGHFVLFVRACVETAQRNKSRDPTELAYVYTPGGGKPFPVLNKDVIDPERSSDASWTAVTGNTVVMNEAQQPHQRPVILPAPTRAFEPSIPPPPLSPSAPPSEYWQTVAGSGNGFQGYRGPMGSSEAGSSSTAAYDAFGGDKKERGNQKEVIPPEIMAEYYDRIVPSPRTPAGTSGTKWYGHDRIAGGPSRDVKGK